MDRYVLQAKKTELEVLKIRQNNPPWQHMKTLKQLKMYHKKSPHFCGAMYKFVTELDYPYDLVYEVMKPPFDAEEKLAWDKSLESYKRLATISEELAVSLIVTPQAALGMIAKREFVGLQLCKSYSEDDLNQNYGEVCWIFGESVEYPGHNPSPQCVQGTNYPGGYAVAENKSDPEKCFIEMYVNCDVGGSLPKSLIEAALPYQQISYLECLKEEVKRRYQKRFGRA